MRERVRAMADRVRARFAPHMERMRARVAPHAERARVWWSGKTPTYRRVSSLAIVAVLALCAMFVFAPDADSPKKDASVSTGDPNISTVPTDDLDAARRRTKRWTQVPPVARTGDGDPSESNEYSTHTVQSGEFIIAIARKLGVPWEAIYIANEKDLGERATKRCAKLSRDYTHKPGRRGHYCNSLVVVNGKAMVNANSLLPGDTLRIPKNVVAPEITRVISNIKGNRIAVVIDDTGSMGGDGWGEPDDRERVSTAYMQAVQNARREIVRVIMFADGNYRELSGGNITFHAYGAYENTRGALELAAKYKPDAIVLVSDEPGDDWMGFRNLHLPPVIAHSLDPRADANLARIAELTGGEFLRDHSGEMVINLK